MKGISRMKQKRILSYMLAILLTVCFMTSCKPTDDHTSIQTESTSSTEKNQENEETSVISADEFVNSLEKAYCSESRFSIDYKINRKYIRSESSVMEKWYFVQLEADLSNAENPCFSYAVRKKLTAEADLLLFYEMGYLYRKENAEQYKYRLEWEKAKAGIPFHFMSEIFGEDWKDVFEEAVISVGEDQSVTAAVEIPLADHLESVKEYLKYFGLENHEQIEETDGELLPIVLSVTLDSEGAFLSQSVEITMETPDQNGGYYPVVYTVSASANEIPEDFTVSVPSEEERAKYPESEPEITEITLEEFIRRLSLSDQKAQNAVYTKMTTNASVVYYSGGGWSVIPVTTVTEVDLSNPKKPYVSMVEMMEFFGGVQKTEVYYKDEVYYYSINNYKFSVPYSFEEYNASVEATAKDKAEAGISTFFITDAMLSKAVLTVNSDQSVSAVIAFDGETQRKNIFYNIESVFNDDYSEITNAVLSNTCVTIILDRFNCMTGYALETTVSFEENGSVYEFQYFIQYLLEYSESPREIIFPDDLNRENYPTLA